MTKLEKLQAAAVSLSDSQIEALIDFAKSMQGKSFYETAPPEAIASLERGLAQIETGQTFSLDELALRLKRAAEQPPR